MPLPSSHPRLRRPLTPDSTRPFTFTDTTSDHPFAFADVDSTHPFAFADATSNQGSENIYGDDSDEAAGTGAKEDSNDEAADVDAKDKASDVAWDDSSEEEGDKAHLPAPVLRDAEASS
ncbi:hypothetical protein ABZP36_029275 [Zizania latifolia]